jgi:hypothetical protein
MRVRNTKSKSIRSRNIKSNKNKNEEHQEREQRSIGAPRAIVKNNWNIGNKSENKEQ